MFYTLQELQDECHLKAVDLQRCLENLFLDVRHRSQVSSDALNRVLFSVEGEYRWHESNDVKSKPISLGEFLASVFDAICFVNQRLQTSRQPYFGYELLEELIEACEKKVPDLKAVEHLLKKLEPS